MPSSSERRCSTLSRSTSCKHLDVGTQAGERGPQLVARVEDQLPLLRHRPLERVEHDVEGRRQPAELVGAVVLDPGREVAGDRDLLGGIGQ